MIYPLKRVFEIILTFKQFQVIHIEIISWWFSNQDTFFTHLGSFKSNQHSPEQHNQGRFINYGDLLLAASSDRGLWIEDRNASLNSHCLSVVPLLLLIHSHDPKFGLWWVEGDHPVLSDETEKSIYIPRQSVVDRTMVDPIHRSRSIVVDMEFHLFLLSPADCT